MARLRVPAESAGARLDRFLAELPEIGSRAVAERLVRDGGVLVDGRARAKSHKLEGGEELEFAAPQPRASTLEPEQMDLHVPYEDEHLLVVDKPAGLVVHPSAGHHSGTLVHGLLALEAEGGDEDRPGIVHRLDRDTSGLMVVARTDEAYERLSQMVRARELERTYLALVHGRPRSRRGKIDAPIGRDRGDATRNSLDTATPRDAVTHFEVAELFPSDALLRVKLETGRMHQIRVHLAAIDLPVVGDPTYGVRDERLDRQFLHSAELSFTHPFTGERVEATSELPADLAGYLERLTSY